MYRIIILLLLSLNVESQNIYWQELEIPQNKQDFEQSFDIKPLNYHLLSLDYELFQQNARQSLGNLLINLPFPNGEFISFEINHVEIMAPELAIKFPNIQTFRGRSLDDTATVVMDITPKGLHAVIKANKKTIWIDPINRETNKTHISYYRTELNNKTKNWQCEADKYRTEPKDQNVTQGLYLVNELTLKKYRLAVAATAEYTAFHSTGAVNIVDGMAAIVTAMNRINGIYESELGIRMILVDNNDQIVFMDSATDNLTNNNGSALLSEIQGLIDNKIGSENYDIGHVFSTGGGGIAYHGVTCDNNYKARGVTGQSTPINDPFYVDYVAHEMGHQWGASHTFNTSAGFCNSNWSSSSAYEPGSGSTIMAYAGICSPDDLQNNSDAYFHTKSLNDINQFASNSATCQISENTNNQAPTIDVVSDYIIPKLTPFTLCAQATDVDSNTLTYNWEQYDRGPKGLSDNPSGNAPIFRTYYATDDDCRTFPKLANILNNTQVKGELLPSYTRNLNFHITVRDNELNGGAFNTGTAFVSVTEDGPFKVSSHNKTNQLIVINDKAIITWDMANTDQMPINCTGMDAWVSIDGGINFVNTTIGIANTGIGTINIPDTSSNQIRIKLKCSNNIFFDINDKNLIIVDDLIHNNGFE